MFLVNFSAHPPSLVFLSYLQKYIKLPRGYFNIKSLFISLVFNLNSFSIVHESRSSVCLFFSIFSSNVLMFSIGYYSNKTMYNNFKMLNYLQSATKTFQSKRKTLTRCWLHFFFVSVKFTIILKLILDPMHTNLATIALALLATVLNI